ncbi:hypothetical protein, conserved [Eimeria maxima]|uniref:RNA-binding S4 domain-containing protein n=1 Tax=Eimeria maxima TaxID=5804 RepID=U6MHI7_EIMMA|nr:hypothetical protein, conserved [Eimeria maxima]CDJ61934.1 hypothetical protein, conserved [Eimeria maxima]
MAIARTLLIRRTQLEWLTRRIALSGCLSRREALAAIESGAVKVDGRTIKRDVEICNEAEVSLLGRVLPAAGALPALFAVLKPRGIGCTYTSNGAVPSLKNLLLQQPDVEELLLNGLTKATASAQKAAADSRQHNKENRESEGEESNNNTAADTGSDEDEDTLQHEYHSICSNNCNSNNNSSNSSSTNKKRSSQELPGHLIPVNPLPVQAEGLVLLTNDGEFAHLLRNPSSKILSAYDLRVSGTLPTADMWRRWAFGVKSEGIDYGRVWVQLLRPCPSGAWLRLKFVEPPGADLRSLLLSCGLKIRRMRLYSFGPYLSTSVPPGILYPLPIDKALLKLHQKQRQRPRLMLVPAAEELPNIIEATQHLKHLKGGGFPAERLLKATSVFSTSKPTKPN